MLHIEQRGDHAEAAEVHAVHQEAHGRVGGAFVLFQFADAAHLEIAGARTGAGEVQVRHLRHGVGEVLGAGGLQRGLVEHHRTGRDLAGGRTAQAGDDDDFVHGGRDGRGGAVGLRAACSAGSA